MKTRQEKYIQCTHQDGWIIDDVGSNTLIDEEILIQVHCNNMDCREQKFMKVIIKEI